MSNKYSRYQSVINREADANIDEDHWLKQFEKNLQKCAVQPRRVDESLFDQINTIMNGKSKHKSVAAAVEDMMQRSGLSNYLEKVKTSGHEHVSSKIATDNEINKQQMKFVEEPIVIKKRPSIKQTIENYIRDTRGNLSVPAILEKIKSIHSKDVSDTKDWEDPNLIKYISNINFKVKSDNFNGEEHHNLGTIDRGSQDSNDSENDDYFSALMPATK